MRRHFLKKTRWYLSREGKCGAEVIGPFDVKLSAVGWNCVVYGNASTWTPIQGKKVDATKVGLFIHRKSVERLLALKEVPYGLAH